MYHKKVMELFLNPQNVGDITKADGKAEIADEACGNVVKMYLKVEEGIIKDAKYKAFGGPVTFAACCVATKIIIGLHIEEAKELVFEQILVELVSVPEEKIVCVQAVVKAVMQAIEYYENKKREKDKK